MTRTFKVRKAFFTIIYLSIYIMLAAGVLDCYTTQVLAASNSVHAWMMIDTGIEFDIKYSPHTRIYSYMLIICMIFNNDKIF